MKNKKRITKKRITKKRQKKNKIIVGGKNSPSKNNYQYILNEDVVNDDNTKITASNNSYDKNLFVRESHNCYTYFLNLKNKHAVELCKSNYNKHNMCRRAQPGYLSGYDNLKKSDYKCPIIMKRTLKDNPNIYRIKDINTKCDPKFYKGALVVAPGRDYHYYRYNDDGVWSHKPGYKPTTLYDSKNNIITNPKKAARNYGGTLNYKHFCGFMCVPRNSTKKNMEHRNYSFNHNNNDKKHKMLEKKTLKKHYNKSNKLKSLGKTIRNYLKKKNS